MLLRELRGPVLYPANVWALYCSSSKCYIDKMDSQKDNTRAEGILKGFRVYHHVWNKK